MSIPGKIILFNYAAVAERLAMDKALFDIQTSMINFCVDVQFEENLVKHVINLD